MKRSWILVAVPVAAAGCAAVFGMDELPLQQPGADAAADATGGDGGTDAGEAGPRLLRVGGTVTGLQGTGLVLQNNGADDLAIGAAGVFAFATPLTTGASYAVTVKTQPSSPAQTCVVGAGSGAVGTADVDSVAVTCSPTCGNGTVEPPEQCDDGARASGDGCSATCAIEPGWECAGTRSGCSRSCVGGGDGRSNCGLALSDNCCASLPVTGASNFSRSYDGVPDGGYADPKYVATVADFRLDKYEVTVGRFRAFVDAVVAGWRPPAGAGKHTHLNGGRGLRATGGFDEPGWDANWNGALAGQRADWDTYMQGPGNTTWTSSPGANERQPTDCVTWQRAYAFCIWDGGFLPSEAEWNYAAAGGTEQRKYPWGSTEPGANANLAVHRCYFNGTGSCSGLANLAPVGSAPGGAGKWGQMDLAGNLWEWVLDLWGGQYSTECVNCAELSVPTGLRVSRGGSYGSSADFVRTSFRGSGANIYGYGDTGFRCARVP